VTQKLSTGTGQVDVPQINSSGKVVWQQYDGSDWEIFFWNGSAVQQLTNNSTDDRNPKINDLGQVAWEHYDGTDWEIYFWDGSTTQQVTNNDTNDLDPEINGSGEITWKNQSTTTFGSGLPPSDILLWDGSTTQALAEKVDPFDAWAPCINDAGQVAWVGHSDINGSRILMWDGVAVQECPQYVSSDGFLPEHGEPRIVID
jgi:hypothetical protein